jgi:hypothetical protein
MNPADMTENLIYRAKNLQEFTIEVEVPDNFRFNGLIPFDMTVQNNIMKAKVFGITREEAVAKFNQYLSENTDI